MRRVIIGIFDLALAANGVFMLALPERWYVTVPGIAATGPFNSHFVRDVGAAYLVAGGALLWFLRDKAARPAAIAGAAFLALHALVHIGDAVAGREALRQLALDIPTVILPGLVIFTVARRRPTSQEEKRHAEMVDPAADRRLRAGL
ncbi:MAG TPA: hypothetical protein VLX85_03940 [Stellaceae bacterium]|nr:hypothetical protein [Stellaceae bacterium]